MQSEKSNGLNESTNKKRQNYHAKIRKEQISEIFRIERIKITQSNLNQKKQQLKQRLAMLQDRQEWIQWAGVKLRGQPEKQWSEVMTELEWVVQLFKTEWQLIKDYGILRALTQTYDQQYKELKLAPLASKILYNLVPQGETRENREYIKQILNYQFVQNVINILADKKVDIADACDHILLLSEISRSDYSYRDQIVRLGGLSTVLQLKQDYKYVNVYFSQVMLTFAETMLKIHNPNELAVYPPRNILKIFVPILSEEIVSPKSQNCLKLIFICLNYIVTEAMQANFRELIHDRNIPKALLENITNKIQQIRVSAIRVCIYLFSTNNNEVVSQFNRMGLLDNLFISYAQHKEDTQTVLNILRLLGNICSSKLEDLIKTFEHPVFEELVIQYSSSSNQNTKTLKEAIYALTTVVVNGNFNVIEVLRNKYGILEIYMRNMDKNFANTQIMKQCLDGIIELCKSYQPYKNGNVNLILDDLCRKYNFQTTVSNISENHKNKEVKAKADFLADILLTMDQKNDDQMEY